MNLRPNDRGQQVVIGESLRDGSGRIDDDPDIVVAERHVIGHNDRLIPSVEAARRWLQEKHAALGGHSALELARTEYGARMVQTLIAQLEHGVFP